MTLHARRFASVSTRTSSQTWRAIIDVLDPPADDRAILNRATNGVALLIAEETTATWPLILTGCGPQARLYTVHGTDAIDGHNVNEQTIPTLEFTDGWQLSLPASGSEAELIGGLIDGTNVVIRDPDADVASESATTSSRSRIAAFDLRALE